MRLRFVLLGFVVVAVATAVGAGWLLRDPLPHFLARRSTLATVHVGSATTEGAYRLTPAHLTATSGLAVDLMLRRAIADSARRLPLVVILGGHHTGREAARLLDDTRGTVVAAVWYPFDGDPRPDAATFLREIPRIRGAFSTRRRRSCSRWTPAAPHFPRIEELDINPLLLSADGGVAVDARILLAEV